MMGRARQAQGRRAVVTEESSRTGWKNSDLDELRKIERGAPSRCYPVDAATVAQGSAIDESKGIIPRAIEDTFRMASMEESRCCRREMPFRRGDDESSDGPKLTPSEADCAGGKSAQSTRSSARRLYPLHDLPRSPGIHGVDWEGKRQLDIEGLVEGGGRENGFHRSARGSRVRCSVECSYMQVSQSKGKAKDSGCCNPKPHFFLECNRLGNLHLLVFPFDGRRRVRE